MIRNIDALILTAMNTCWREPITLPILLGLLREQHPPGEWIGPVRQLFADVSVNAIRRFAEHHQLSPALMGRYYTQFIRPLGDINPELEAWVHGRLGTPL